MMRSMYSGVSGLKNHQTRMDVIGNNIANINTNGYKKSRVVFKDTLYQKMRGASSPVSGGRGGTNPMAIGLGMGVSSVDQIHTATATTTTSKLTDMAIDGNGYFVLKNGAQTYFTRAGNFDFDELGMLTNVSNGYNVQGWMADNTTTNAAGDWPITIVPATTETIDISGYKMCAPRATTESEFGGNLDSAMEYNEIQLLTFAADNDGGAAGSYFRLTYNGQNTDWISVGVNATATAANIQTALEQLGSIGTDNVAVTYNSTAAIPRYEIMFQNDLASIDVPSITCTIGDTDAYAGAAPSIAETIPGVTGTTDEQQTIDVSGGTAGSYILSYNGNQTGLIAYDATAAEVEDALQALTGLSGVTVAGPVLGVYTVTFPNSLGDVNDLGVTAFTTAFTGGAGTVDDFDPIDPLFNPEEGNYLTTSQDVYDSEGNSYTVYYRFFKYGIVEGPPTITNWGCDISLDPQFEEATGYSSTATNGYSTVDMDSTAPEASLEIGAKQIRRLYNIQFDTEGRIVGGTPDDDPFTLSLVGVNSDTTGSGTPLGTNQVDLTIDFSALTQYNSDSTAKGTYQDGYATGSLTSYTVGIDGTIIGSYDNGESRSLARVALANFENPAGMIQVGGTLFQESANSGTAAINAPTIEGLGSIIPSSLEMSNVDLSEEFTDMIVTQRGFQANSRIITTSDEMIQELVNLKR